MTNLEALEAAALADTRTEHTARAHGLVCIWDGAFEYYRAADFDAGVYEPLTRSIAAEIAEAAILVSPHGGNAELPASKPLAVVVVTIHAGDHSRAVFGPFENGEAASAWGFRNFPDNTAPSGHAVTWCWEPLALPTGDIAAFVRASVN